MSQQEALNHTHHRVGDQIFARKTKHPAFILAMDNQYFQPFYVPGGTAGIDIKVNNFKDGVSAYPAEMWLHEAQPYLAIRQREWLDETLHTAEQSRDNSDLPKGTRKYRQLLPYVMIRQRQANGELYYFPYRRTNRVGEKDLAGNVSIGYGGHIDLADIIYHKSVIELALTIKEAAYREVFDEETYIRSKEGAKVTFTKEAIKYANLFIADNSVAVNQLHLGVLMVLEIPEGYSLTTKEDELTTMQPMTAHQLLQSDLPMESWTKLYLEYEHGRFGTAEAQQ